MLQSAPYKIEADSGNQNAEKEALEAGANEFLNKDLVLTELADRVKAYVFN